MTDAQMIELIKTIIGDSSADENELSSYLDLAKDAIVHRLYPIDVPEGYSMESRYDRLACRIAADMYLRRGAEGETVHIENGLHRTYRSTNWEELLMYVTPYAKVM